MHASAGLSTEQDARSAAVEAALQARTGLPGRPDLAVVFASPHFADQAEVVLDAVHEGAGPAAVVGCVAEGVVGGGKEIERSPGVAVWLSTLPAPVQPFHATFDPDGAVFAGWPDDPGSYLMIADPYTFPADVLLQRVNTERPGTTIVGGMAGGAEGAGGTRLFVDREVVSTGAVGVRMPDSVEMLTHVSQGCRPVGRTFAVTKARGNIVFELAGKPAMQRVREMLGALDERDRSLLQSGLLLGRVIDEYKTDFDRGDFLVRGVIGADPNIGAIAIADSIEVGETIQFHVRDSESADEDLEITLDRARARLGDLPPAGALLFTCNGRGARLFERPHHDAGLVSERLGAPPLAGFFCAGELGPIGGKNWLHGFTASLALFRSRSEDPDLAAAEPAAASESEPAGGLAGPDAAGLADPQLAGPDPAGLASSRPGEPAEATGLADLPHAGPLAGSDRAGRL